MKEISLPLFAILILALCPVSPARAEGAVTGLIKVDNAGWLPADRKVAVTVKDPAGRAELRRSADDSVAFVVPPARIVHFGIDDDSGDDCWEIDFSEVTNRGSYYVYLPAFKARSYDFEISGTVYDSVGRLAMKSYYYQRCNTPKEAKYAGPWTDKACHLADLKCPPFKNAPDLGSLNLSGGWHDAGDYQKTLWWSAVEPMLWAYELFPDRWTDGQLGIPESGNLVPDLLDETCWELDFFLRMQRPDGHFLSSVKGCNSSVTSPPSASDEVRGYFDVKSYGCSGGGATPEFATGYATLCLAHASILFAKLGRRDLAARYGNAARKGWRWLDRLEPADRDARTMKACAASAVFRLDPGVSSAKKFIEGYPGTGDPGPAGYDLVDWAIWEYLANPAADPAVADRMKSAVAEKIVKVIFQEESEYTSLRGKAGDTRDWHWGSSQNQGAYANNLLLADRFGIRAGHSASEMRNLGEKYLHFMLGRNSLNMAFLSSMQSAGVEHSSFQLFHGWFSYTGGDGDHGNLKFNGKPADLVEPLYPYYKEDDALSTYGPAPGLVVGGPNGQYAKLKPPADRKDPARMYRDFSVGCRWNGHDCEAASWEITEPCLGYQGQFILLVSFFMGPAK